MPIVGFNFEKVNAEKKGVLKQQLKIDSNLNVINAEIDKLPLGKAEEVIRFTFEFFLKYAEAGEISFRGNVLYLDEPKKIKDMMKSWKKDKKVSPEIMSQLLNAILFRCNIKAIALSQDVNLPPHIKMPRVAPKQKEEDYIG